MDQSAMAISFGMHVNDALWNRSCGPQKKKPRTEAASLLRILDPINGRNANPRDFLRLARVPNLPLIPLYPQWGTCARRDVQDFDAGFGRRSFSGLAPMSSQAAFYLAHQSQFPILKG